MKIRPLAADVFHADRGTSGQMDMTNIIATFYNFANKSKERMTPVNQFESMRNSQDSRIPTFVPSRCFLLERSVK